MLQKDVYVSFDVNISGMLNGEEATHVAELGPQQAGNEQEKRIEAVLHNLFGGATVKVTRVYMNISEYRETKSAE